MGQSRMGLRHYRRRRAFDRFVFVSRYTAIRQTATVRSPAKSIAVLPFENLSRDPDNAYFAEGYRMKF